MPPDDSAAVVAAPAPAPAPAAAPPPPSALAAAAPPPPDPAEKIPEKFRVMVDGKIDANASWLKVEEHRAHLEQRLGSGEIRPKTADEYVVTVPDAAKDAFDPADPLLAEFRTKAHEAGFSQKQFDLAISEYTSRLLQLADSHTTKTAAECVAELKKDWPTEDTYKANFTAAFRAVTAYGGTEAEALMAQYGNDPKIIRLLASIGKELKEDAPPPDGGNTPPPDFSVRIAELQNEIPKLLRSDAKRVAMQAELDGLFAKMHGTKAVG